LISQVSAEIERLIFEGPLEPGSSLPPVGELAKRFSVNRLVVREALRAAEARGLIVAHQGKPAQVLGISSAPLRDFFSLAVRREPGALLELVDVRMAAEVRTVALAAARHREIDPALIAEMRDSIDVMTQQAHKGRDFSEADVRFHEALARASGNSLLELLLLGLRDAMRTSRRVSADGSHRIGGDPEEAVRRHREILEYVTQGDVERATAAMESHLGEAARDLQASQDVPGAELE
jgi:GntR family transcriptional repressor for pyruvate dehydrogenase complex